MQKPNTIWQFERVLVLATLIEMLNAVISAQHAREVLADPALAEIGLGWGTYLGVVIAGPLFALVVWHFIVQRASHAARVVYTALVVLALGQAVLTFADSLKLLPAMTLFVKLASLGVQTYAVVLLFRPASSAWFTAGIGNRSVPQRHRAEYRD